MFLTLISEFENTQNSFSCGLHFGPFWSVKYLNFEKKLPIWTAHHTFLESKHPEVTTNPYHILFLEGSQKKVSTHGLFVIIQSNPWNITFNKGATKLYFMRNLHMVIVFFSTGLYNSAFSTFSFGKFFLFFLCFGFSCFYIFDFLLLFFLFYVLNSMSFLIMSDLITLFNFLLTLFKWSVKI